MPQAAIETVEELESYLGEGASDAEALEYLKRSGYTLTSKIGSGEKRV